MLPPGTDLASAVAAALNRATLILLLISPDYLSSDDCFEVELSYAMQRHQAGTAREIRAGRGVATYSYGPDNLLGVGGCGIESRFIEEESWARRSKLRVQPVRKFSS